MSVTGWDESYDAEVYDLRLISKLDYLTVDEIPVRYPTYGVRQRNIIDSKKHHELKLLPRKKLIMTTD